MSLSTFPAGTYTITITAKDDLGKIGIKSVSIKVEQAVVVPPVTPPDDETVRGVRR